MFSLMNLKMLMLTVWTLLSKKDSSHKELTDPDAEGVSNTTLNVGTMTQEKNIGTAKAHAAEQGLTIDYRATTAEDLAAAGEQFDVILNMEVVEHVADVKLFMASCATMLKPGGMMIVATLNRTFKAWALAIVGAEYVLGWLPRGTHDWQKFLTPGELRAALEEGGLKVADLAGVVYNPIADRWSRSSDTGVNYMMLGMKP